MLSQTHVHHFSGSKRAPALLSDRLIFILCGFFVVDNIDLGTACGKFYRVGVLAVTDAGDADLGYDKA